MYIVSKFRDYYDTAISYGIDKQCVYKREKKEIENKGSYQNGFSTFRNDWYVRTSTIGFCGKLYPVLEIFKSYWDSSKPGDVFYDFESVKKFLEEHKIHLPEKSKYRNSFFCRNRLDNMLAIKEYFQVKEDNKLFMEHKVPVFIKRKHNFFVVNPCLKDYKFYRVKDPHTAFQEIYMYMAGVIGNTEKETVDIDDTIRAKQHGFNEYSFKTLKGDKKPRKKNRGKDA